MIKPIQTNYSDCIFRSRLEARWAVFFDFAGIKWEYEPEGFEITGFSEEDEKWKYLPDFFLPDSSTWVEIKPNIIDLSDDYLYMLQWAVDWNGQLPHIADSCGSSSGIILLTNIPKTNGYDICHPILQHHKGGYVNIAVFERSAIKVYENSGGFFDATWGDKTCIKKFLLDIDNYQGPCSQDKVIESAYIRARKARFEYGASI